MCNVVLISTTSASGIPHNQVDVSNYKANRYGDGLVVQLKGIVALGFEIVTRVHEWTLSNSRASGQIEPNSANLEFCQEVY
jgi:hypothetical protein